jgi:transcriptional regulator with XRE-family HTH domain
MALPSPTRAAHQEIRMPAKKPAEAATDTPLLSLARQVRGWADAVLGMAGTATDMGFALAQSRVQDPGKKVAVEQAGRQLRQWREAAGLTLDEVSKAIGLGDSKLITQAEGGIASLPFDVVLRLAGVLGRHDPLPVAMALTRQYNPGLWKSLESLGIGKLAVQGTRERELANIYRSNDAARDLDDVRFAAVLAFTQQAFETALVLTEPAARTPTTAATEESRATRTAKTLKTVKAARPAANVKAAETTTRAKPAKTAGSAKTAKTANATDRPARRAKG